MKTLAKRGLGCVAFLFFTLTLPLSVSAQSYVQHCKATTVCVDGPPRVCQNGQVCWYMAVGPIGVRAIYLKPEPSSLASLAYERDPYDLQNDGKMDCWRGITNNPNESSGFPFRDNGWETHNGSDITSGTSNYGRGAPIRSLGTGEVTVAHDSDTSANGVYIRVRQADGVEMTYIHLLDLKKADGTYLQVGDTVEVGEQMGRMNCTGNCGGAPGQAGHKLISKTHVHVQARRIADGVLVDPIDLYGGDNCSLSGGSTGGGTGGGSGPGGGGTCTGTICNEEP